MVNSISLFYEILPVFDYSFGCFICEKLSKPSDPSQAFKQSTDGNGNKNSEDYKNNSHKQSA